MANILTTVGTMVSQAVNWASQFIHMITAEGNEILLLFVLLPLIGLGIGLTKRMLHV